MAVPTTAFARPMGSDNAQSLKRKANDPTTSFSRRSANKAVKHNNVDSPRGYANGGTIVPKFTTVEDESNEQDDDQEAGPALPPDENEEGADDLSEDDEEGRFFGGGVTKEEKDVLDYVEQNEDDAPDEVINLAWLKKTALNFERKINKNAELRVKYEDDPMKFVSSEADLDAEIKNLSILSDHPDLYRDFVRSGCSDSLVGLLAHDNTDIAIASCEIIADLTDEDSGATADDWSHLVKSMLKADLVPLLVSNLGRLDAKNEYDTAGIYHMLNVMENLLSDPANAAKLGKEPKLLPWLLRRINEQDEMSLNKIGQNRQYAAEILVIIAQNDTASATALVNQGAVDTLLQLLSTWRRRDPEKDSEEQEFAGNLFDCLLTLVHTSTGRQKFLQDEGIELCLIMLKEGKFAKHGALRVLDHAAAGFDSTDLCERLVEAGGLKQIFTLLMKSKKLERQLVEHLIGVIVSLLRVLPGASATRIRTLAKLVENNYEKCKRLLELRVEYSTRLIQVKKTIAAERLSLSAEDAQDMESEHLSRQMDAGLFPLQSLDVILAWTIAEDGGARSYILSALKNEQDHPEGVEGLRKSLTAQLDEISHDTADSTATKDMLQALLSHIE